MFSADASWMFDVGGLGEVGGICKQIHNLQQV
jgi:hypothetical protein